ncbi:hypothetical protein OZX74_03845 [Bifidobacterium sp. ESL0798]|uniref:hypothetical protein n=1 Tax=Bifidobacterium sp. ESL0798 TaxID=2983235 RepID=UPI0023F8A630|nr:hypothetical protein [Bifidobacterium sp. ESL0798]WEV74660.1 hypothetical protein OZX74_03845 [Bifidobacterium sp. ESL0798]
MSSVAAAVNEASATDTTASTVQKTKATPVPSMVRPRVLFRLKAAKASSTSHIAAETAKAAPMVRSRRTLPAVKVSSRPTAEKKTPCADGHHGQRQHSDAGEQGRAVPEVADPLGRGEHEKRYGEAYYHREGVGSLKQDGQRAVRHMLFAFVRRGAAGYIPPALVGGNARIFSGLHLNLL